MPKNKKIAIIGHFGGNKYILDGQTIKTKILYDELSKATDWQIKKVDTYYKKNNPIKLLWDSFITLLFTKDIIVLLSGNGMRFYFPILSFFANVFGTRIYHDVIGGNLDSYIKKIPGFRKYLNSFEVNWVETANLKDRVEKCGVTNCEVIPNFKRLNILSENEIQTEQEVPSRFCTFSRVMKEKGIEAAIAAIESINAEAGSTICVLDIYGMIDKGYREQFEKILRKVTPAIQYKGIIPYDKSVEILKYYTALLFPTYWKGEGFPGTIIDAFSAGLPVIATDWNCNGEIVCNMNNGILYPNKDIKKIESAIEWGMSHEEEMGKMRINCIKSAKMYQPERYIKKIITEIEGKNIN